MSRKQRIVSALAVAISLACMGAVGWRNWPQTGAAADSCPGAGPYRETSFAVLAFPYTPPPRQTAAAPISARPDPFPAEVRALDGRKISITGYMAPLSMNAGRIDAFFLPKITDYVRVSMAPGQFAPNADIVRVNGVLEVGEERNSLGAVETVYHMTADSVQKEEIEGSGWAEVAAWGVGGLFCLALFGPAGSRAIKAFRERSRPGPAVRDEAMNG